MLFDLKTLSTNSKDKESWYSNKVFFLWFVRNGTRMLTLSTFHLNAIFASSARLSVVDVYDEKINPTVTTYPVFFLIQYFARVDKLKVR